MKLERVSSPIPNKLLSEYWANETWVKSFFSYNVNDEGFRERLDWVQQQTYDRAQLAKVVRSYMAPYTISQKAEQHLQQLSNDAVVVVGGQQAGILTGPLFSVYKAISVILIAKQQQDKLRVPVVPLFWIAGEDHDIDEINHTYTMEIDRVIKRIFGEPSRIKKMASYTDFNKEQLRMYVQSIFKDYGETEYSAELLQRVLAPINTTSTFTEYFTALFNELFVEEGLLLIDAAYEPFRKMQSGYFTKLIERNEQIANAVVAQEREFTQLGFAAPIEATSTNANLFYVEQGERFLLERKEGQYVNALKGVHKSKSELIELAQQHPEQLSNNVVTRPLMQEMSIPVLAFVGGPGELAYWATLKTAFEAAGLRMPLFIPRLSVTVVGRKAQYAMQQSHLKVADAFDNRIEQLKSQYIEQQKNDDISETIANMEQQLLLQYETLATQLEVEDVHLDKTLARNEHYHQQQFDYLKRKIQEQYEVKHEAMLRQMNIVQAQLLPNGKPQERLYSVYQLENDFGTSVIKQIMQTVEPIEKQHIVLYV